MAGSCGAQLISALAPEPGPREIMSPKRAYGAFEGVNEDEALDYLKRVYGARITMSDALTQEALAKSIETSS
jgi:nicotinamidase-related amidase